MHLFSISDQEPQKLNLQDAEVLYYPNFLDSAFANDSYQTLHKEIPWQQDTITVFGKKHLQPRLTALYGNNEIPYSYSNITMRPLPFTFALSEIKKRIERLTNIEFTTCLCNLYRNGKDSNGWHADDEASLGTNPVIASISLGATRLFKFRRISDHKTQYKLALTSGSLLVMKGATQHYWQHQLPKTAKQVGSRINLTFRVVK